jgi:hypothetical protein
MGLAMAAKIEYLCFAPLSAGIFCGMQRRAQVVSVGMHAVAQFSYSGLKEVHFVGCGREQRVELCGILWATPCPPLATAHDPESEDAEAMMLPSYRHGRGGMAGHRGPRRGRCSPRSSSGYPGASRASGSSRPRGGWTRPRFPTLARQRCEARREREGARAQGRARGGGGAVLVYGGG